MVSLDYGKRLLDVSNASANAYANPSKINQSSTLLAINERPTSAYYKDGTTNGRVYGS